MTKEEKSSKASKCIALGEDMEGFLEGMPLDLEWMTDLLGVIRDGHGPKDVAHLRNIATQIGDNLNSAAVRLRAIGTFIDELELEQVTNG